MLSAHKAFVSGVWSRRLPAERERILLRYADLLEQHAEELAQLETLEQGKSIMVARAFEVGVFGRPLLARRGLLRLPLQVL